MRIKITIKNKILDWPKGQIKDNFRIIYINVSVSEQLQSHIEIKANVLV